MSNCLTSKKYIRLHRVLDAPGTNSRNSAESKLKHCSAFPGLFARKDAWMLDFVIRIVNQTRNTISNQEIK
jgi:hypothetical protein